MSTTKQIKEALETVKLMPVESKPKTLFDTVEEKLPVIKRALPAHITPERFMQVVLNSIRRTPKLMDCTTQSVLGAIYALAQVGLEPDGRNAYLIPQKNKKTGVSTAEPRIDYRGYIELARRSGKVADIYAEVVYEADEFTETKGANRQLIHVPYEGDGDPGKLTHAYAVVNYTNGGQAWVVLRRRDIEARKQRSQSAKSDYSPWKSDEAAMWLKSAIRALSKYLPYSPEIVAAEHIDRGLELGHTFQEGEDVSAIDFETETRLEEIDNAEIVDAEIVEESK